MKKEIADRWVAALRSGEYSQARGMLRYKDGYCCLGVLTDLAVKDGVVAPWGYSGDTTCAEAAVLSPEVGTWAGLGSKNGHYTAYGYRSLAEDNDLGATFGEIADIIESRVDEL